MAKGKLVSRLMIPARESRAFEVKEGQILRIVEHEGPQVADVNAFNVHNLREHLQSALSAQLNGSFRKFSKLYSNSPSINTMFTIIDDPVGVHFLSGSVGCTARHYEMFYGIKGHPNCFDNLARAITPWGLSHYDVHGPLNVFMNVTYESGRMTILPPVSKKGDYLDLAAEMDVLVAISACPGDKNPTNGEDRKPKALEVIVYAN